MTNYVLGQLDRVNAVGRMFEAVKPSDCNAVYDAAVKSCATLANDKDAFAKCKAAADNAKSTCQKLNTNNNVGVVPSKMGPNTKLFLVLGASALVLFFWTR